MSKQQFIDALYEVPDVLAGRIFGDIDTIPMPETEEDAMIAVGKLSANLNNAFLKPLAKLDVTELLLRVGQRSSTAISNLLAGLEVIAGSGGGKLTILSPVEGGAYPNYFECACSGNGLTSVVVTIGEMEIDLAQTDGGNTWNGYPMIPIPTGKHQAAFLATFGDGSTAAATINFETTANIGLVATFPANETSYSPEEIAEVSVTLSDEAATNSQAVNVNIFGQTLTLEQQEGNVYKKDLAELNLSLFDWAGLNLMLVSVTNEDGTKTEELRFEIRGGDEEAD